MYEENSEFVEDAEDGWVLIENSCILNENPPQKSHFSTSDSVFIKY